LHQQTIWLSWKIRDFKNVWVARNLRHSSGIAPGEHDISEARKWLMQFNENSLPPNIGDVTYSRSSGPGGQNVNKYVAEKCVLFPSSDLL